MNALAKDYQVCGKSKLYSLARFLHNERLLRVMGRLRLVSVDKNSRFPFIMPPKHHLSQLISF